MNTFYLDPEIVEEECGYRPFTTFWEDFSIAEGFGRDAILDTYSRAFNSWKSDYKYVTELALILNWKCWALSEGKTPTAELYARTYLELWQKTDQWCYEHLKGEEAEYYFKTID